MHHQAQLHTPHDPQPRAVLVRTHHVTCDSQAWPVLAAVCGWGSPNTHTHSPNTHTHTHTHTERERERERERAGKLQGGFAASVFPEKWKGTFARVAGALTN
jgi:hypothetical protein